MLTCRTVPSSRVTFLACFSLPGKQSPSVGDWRNVRFSTCEPEGQLGHSKRNRKPYSSSHAAGGPDLQTASIGMTRTLHRVQRGVGQAEWVPDQTS